MANFLITEIKAGDVLQNQKMTFVFPYEGELEYTRITKSCVCSIPIVDPETKTIRVSYTSPVLGKHPATGAKIMNQETWKVVKVELDDVVIHTLKFLTNVVRHI